MKTTAFFIILFACTQMTLAQADSTQKITDSTRRYFPRQALFVDPLKKNTHIVDIEFVPWELNEAALGYNYFYSINKRVSIGGRIGGWYFDANPDVPLISARWRFTFSAFAMTNIRIWRSIQGEVGFGYIGSYSGPEKTNTFSPEEKFDDGNVAFRAGVNITLFNHLFIRGGAMYQDTKYSNGYTLAIVSIGYSL